jgi:hypothetical protein
LTFRTMREWLAWAEPWALGELGLRPWEFWRLTPREFSVMFEAFFRAENRAWLHSYALIVAIRSPHMKRPEKVESFMGRRMLDLWPRRPKADD